ncbi:MAG TPA: hotdog domain-containing protein [Acidimicrobiales bacterium]|nr:hotdog domain-containing protein [Acidimicrobiales bacterium]
MAHPPSDTLVPPVLPRPGVSATATLVVTAEDTAVAMRSGEVPVLSTPRLLGLCEEASNLALSGRLAPGKTTVATRVQFDHLAPVPVGATVRAEAVLSRVHGRRLIFTISASLRSEAGPRLVGAGRLTRVVVDQEGFMSRASSSGPR